MKRILCIWASLFAALLLPCADGFAWQMEPTPTKNCGVVIDHESLIQRLQDRASPTVAAFMSDSVHERIAHHIYGCEGDKDTCSKPDGAGSAAPPAVIAGTEWNDNPPFYLKQSSIDACQDAITREEAIQLPKKSVCWAKLMKDAEKKAKSGMKYDYASGAALALRVHYGDLQFLHSMASQDGEDPAFTRQRVLMWAEFTWKVATGDFVLGTRLDQTSIEGMSLLFSNGWSVQQLFTLGDPTYRRQIKEVAFGSLLHMISDSFALSHTDRVESTGDTCKGFPDVYEPGRIRNFHSYALQDHKKHGEEDTQDALELHFAEVGPNVVEIGKALLPLYKQQIKWGEIKPLFECIFALDETVTPAAAGALYSAD